MVMNTVGNPEHFPMLTPDSYQFMAARTAFYEDFDNPRKVLEQGLSDEVVEMLEQVYGDDYWTVEKDLHENVFPKDDLKSELGDLLWYGSQLIRLKGESLSHYIPTETWENPTPPESTKLKDTIQAAHIPGYPYLSKDYDFAVQPIVCLALLSVTLNDARYLPTRDYMVDEDTALKDIFRGITVIANLRGYSLRDIGEANIAKLAARDRKPHTIDHVTHSLPSLGDQKLDLYLKSMRN